MDRFTAEQIIRDLTGGQVPSTGDTLFRDGKGWHFRPAGLSEATSITLENFRLVISDEEKQGWAAEFGKRTEEVWVFDKLIDFPFEEDPWPTEDDEPDFKDTVGPDWGYIAEYPASDLLRIIQVQAIGQDEKRGDIYRIVMDSKVSGKITYAQLPAGTGTWSIPGHIATIDGALQVTGSVIIGIDPGGTDTLRVGGHIRADIVYATDFVLIGGSTSNGIEGLYLNFLEDVDITGPVNGHVLTYEDGIWVNKPSTGGSGPVGPIYFTDILGRLGYHQLPLVSGNWETVSLGLGVDPDISYKLDINGDTRVGGIIYAHDFVLLGGSTSGGGEDIWLNSLVDVYAPNPSEGDVLRFLNGWWTHSPISGGGGNVTTVFGRDGVVTAQESDYQNFYPRLSIPYLNPGWIASLSFDKLTFSGLTSGHVLCSFGGTDAAFAQLSLEDTIGNIPASRVTEGTFGSGNYTMSGILNLGALGQSTGIFNEAIRGYLHADGSGNFGFVDAGHSDWILRMWGSGVQVTGGLIVTSTINGQTISGAANFTGNLNVEGSITEQGVPIAKLVVTTGVPSGTYANGTIIAQVSA
jgi:hypothetical protein